MLVLQLRESRERIARYEREMQVRESSVCRARFSIDYFDW
jgi:hypothetical protein